MVVDINLPEMSGNELCSVLVASGRGLPATLITGRNDLATQRLIAKAQVVASPAVTIAGSPTSES
jgi:FixJ family two-component response regulator